MKKMVPLGIILLLVAGGAGLLAYHSYHNAHASLTVARAKNLKAKGDCLPKLTDEGLSYVQGGATVAAYINADATKQIVDLPDGATFQGFANVFDDASHAHGSLFIDDIGNFNYTAERPTIIPVPEGEDVYKTYNWKITSFEACKLH